MNAGESSSGGHAGLEVAVDTQVETACVQWGQWTGAQRDLGRHKSFRIAGGHGIVLGYTAKETADKENRTAGEQEPAEASDSEFVVTWSALLCGFLQPSSPAGGGREAQLDCPRVGVLLAETARPGIRMLTAQLRDWTEVS